MAWQQFIFRCDAHHSEQFCDILNKYGASSITIRDAGDVPIFEPPINTTPLWPNIIINALFPAQDDLSQLIRVLSQNIHQAIDFKIEILEDKDWVREWMDNYHPIPFGDKLWICPSWLEPPKPDAVNIMLDPGLAFGTGTHATTSLCLKWLDAYAQNNDLSNIQMIDFGCGSGILAIAALKLGVKKVYAVDIDVQALESTKNNADKNNCYSGLNCLMARQFEQQYRTLQTDLLVANILARPLIDLSGLLKSKVKAGGFIVLSGILANQTDKVLAAYKDEFDFDRLEQEDDWVRLSGQKRHLSHFNEQS